MRVDGPAIAHKGRVARRWLSLNAQIPKRIMAMYMGQPASQIKWLAMSCGADKGIIR